MVHKRELTCNEAFRVTSKHLLSSHFLLYLRIYTCMELLFWQHHAGASPLSRLRRVLESILRSTVSLAGFQALSVRGMCYTCALKPEFDSVDAQKWMLVGSTLFALERPTRREVVNKMLFSYTIDAVLHDHLPTHHYAFICVAAFLFACRVRSPKGARSLLLMLLT